MRGVSSLGDRPSLPSERTRSCIGARDDYRPESNPRENTVTSPSKKSPDPILIVDDRADVLSAVSRLMSLWFENVLSAETPNEAEALLRQHQPKYLLCDYHLGNDHPPATELVARWREEWPCLERVALMTGTRPSSIRGSPGVDHVFAKPLEVSKVVEFFLAQSE